MHINKRTPGYSRERGLSPVPTSRPLGGLPAAAEQTPTRGPDLCANLKVARYFCRNTSVRLVRSDAKPTGVFELAFQNEETPVGCGNLAWLRARLAQGQSVGSAPQKPPTLPLPRLLAEQRLPRDVLSGRRRTPEPPLISPLAEETACPVSLSSDLL